MQYVFAIEAFGFILALFAFIVAVIARFRWRWLRLSCWLLLMIWAAGAWTEYPEGYRLEKLNAAYATLMLLAWSSRGALTTGVTLLPLIGFWRVGKNKVPIGRSWRLVSIVGVASCFLLLFGLTTVGRDVYVRKQMAQDRLFNQLRAAVLTPAAVAADDDAAPVYFRTYDEMIASERSLTPSATVGPEVSRRKDALPAWLRDVDHPLFNSNTSEVLAFRERHRGELVSVLAASKVPGANLREPESNVLREVSRERVDAIDSVRCLIVVEILQLAREGDISGCWEYLSCINGIRRHTCAQRHGLWFHVSRMFDISRAAITQRILFEQSFDWTKFPFPLASDPYISRTPAMEAVQLEAAEVFELTVANDLCELDGDDRIYDHEAQDALRRAGPVRHLFALYSRVFELADGLRTYPSSLAFCQEVAEPSHRPTQDVIERLTTLSDFPPSKLVSLGFMSALLHYECSIDSDARRRITDLAIAMAGFKSREGRYPLTIQELVPEFLSDIQVDPWDGRPLRFRAKDDGVLIYSVGRNQKDEGGYGDLTDPYAPDITFRLGGTYREVLEHEERKAKTKQTGPR